MADKLDLKQEMISIFQIFYIALSKIYPISRLQNLRFFIDRNKKSTFQKLQR